MSRKSQRKFKLFLVSSKMIGGKTQKVKPNRKREEKEEEGRVLFLFFIKAVPLIISPLILANRNC